MSTAAATASASASAPETAIENEVVGGNDLPMTFKVRENGDEFMHAMLHARWVAFSLIGLFQQ